jgi:alanine racemase
LKTVSIEGTERAWVEIDLQALVCNYRSLAASLPAGCAVLPVVKAGAYGLGARRCVEALAALDPWGFGVASVTEGAEVRRAGWTGRVVVFFPTPPLDFAAAVEGNLELVMSGLEGLTRYAAAARAVGVEVPVHMEIDTGLGRFGVAWNRTDEWVPMLQELLAPDGVRLVGTMTHYHSADSDPVATEEQWRRFGVALGAMREAGIDPGTLHTAASAATMVSPHTVADLIRPGIYLYGGGRYATPPEAVISVRARVLDVRDVPAGATISYGATYVTPAPARLASLGIGYGDGLRRELGNRGRVLLRGREAPIRGVVCMDSTVVDVTEIPGVEIGDVATIIGRDGEREIKLDEHARHCGTIDYEILTGWTGRLPRLEVGLAARERNCE